MNPSRDLFKIFKEAVDPYSVTKLNDAIAEGKTEKALSIIPHCTDLDNKNGKISPLTYSIIHKNKIVINSLLDAGASPNRIKSLSCLRPIELAVLHQLPETVTYLVEKGAKVTTLAIEDAKDRCPEIIPYLKEQKKSQERSCGKSEIKNNF